VLPTVAVGHVKRFALIAMTWQRATHVMGDEHHVCHSLLRSWYRVTLDSWVMGIGTEPCMRISTTFAVERPWFVRSSARSKGVTLVLIAIVLGALLIGDRPLTLTIVSAQEQPAWPDTYVARLEALALIQTLNAEILASRSATQSLENWCRDHRLAEEPRIAARVVAGRSKPPDAGQRQRLEVTDRDEVKYRRVELRCGSHVLSEADNWYVPGRLTAEMNRLLDTTDTPFGTVVRSLEPYRRTFAMKLLWAPLPDGWEREPAAASGSTGRTLVIPDALFQHQAVLYDRSGRPFSEVSEIYQRDILGFAPRLVH
jgi:hypothetical protein